MSYATVDEIVNEFKRLDITSTDAVLDSAKIQSFLDQDDALIDTFLSNRYTTPITGAKSLLFVKKIEIDLTSFRVVKILAIKKAVPDSKSAYQEILEGKFYDEAMMKLKKLASGKIKLPDALGLAGKTVRSFNQKNNITPTFKKDERQW